MNEHEATEFRNTLVAFYYAGDPMQEHEWVKEHIKKYGYQEVINSCKNYAFVDSILVKVLEDLNKEKSNG